MNLRAMDAVFPIREKSVNLIKILNESSPKDADELRYIDAVRTLVRTTIFRKFNEVNSESSTEFRDIDAV